MATPLVPQEIYLLERYCSLDYFGEMRDSWAKMVKVADDALRLFMDDLPSNYRSRPLPEQPDIVWGERVLPTFRSTLESLNQGYIMLSHGDLSALGFGGNVQSAIKGQTSDYSASWMPKQLEDNFWHWMDEAGVRAFNMSITEYAGWVNGSLSTGFSEESRGLLSPPATWPIYRLNNSVLVKSGEPVARSGIYLPASDESCPEVLIKDYEGFTANIGYNPVTTHEFSRQETVWTLVERVADSGGGVPGVVDSVEAGIRLRCAAPGPCPREGIWFTPARLDSRRRFQAGEVMPEVGGTYGLTIWHWDSDQTS